MGSFRKYNKFIQKKIEVDFILLATVLILVSFGIIMVFSASSYVALHNIDYNFDQYYFLKKQGLIGVFSFALMLFIQRINYHFYRNKKILLGIIGITIVLLILVLFMKDSHGAHRWIRLGPLSLQPSEVAKYTVVLLLAHSMAKQGDNIKHFLRGVLPYFVISGFFAGMVLIEDSLSIAAVIMGVTIIMLFVAGTKTIHLGAVIGSVISLGITFILIEPYRLKRLDTFLDPFSDPQGKGYQIIQSWYALASGGLLGLGFGQSRQKCFFIPEPHNDFIFSIIGEELGFVGCMFLIILFVIIISRGIKIAVNARDTYGTLLATGITSVIAIQAIINIAVVSGAMPVTGVPLPFVSYGGSALLVNLAAIGVLLNISSNLNTKK